MDFGPTVLSLCGVKIPETMQGKPFLGSDQPATRPYIYGATARMDEHVDCVRALRDKAVEHWHRSLELNANQPRLRKLLTKYQPATVARAPIAY